MYMYVYIYICICMYMYVYVYICVCGAFAQVYVYSMCVYVCAKAACFSAHETKCLQQNQPRAKMHVFFMG